jgi:hypothetical protein
MEKIWICLVFVVLAIWLPFYVGFNDIGQQRNVVDNTCIYYHPTIKASADVDCNELVYGGSKYSQKFFGTMTNIQIKLTGSDTSLGVRLYIDPPEVGESQSDDLLLVKEWSSLSCTTGYYDYVIPSLDSDTNVWGGSKKYGNVYVAVVDTNSTLTTDAKIWILTE